MSSKLQYVKKPSGATANENLFSHVSKLIQTVVDDKNPVKGVDKLEVLSSHLKNT
jgi:hypothetical protein